MTAERTPRIDVLDFPVDQPLTIIYDETTGELTIDSIVFHNPGGPSEVLLRLHFSAEAAYGFVNGMREVEDRLAVVIEGRRPTTTLQ